MPNHYAELRCAPIMSCLLIAGTMYSGEAKEKAAAPDSAVELRADNSGNLIAFQTEQMEGTIRLDGPYHGVSKLVDRGTGRQVIDPRYSALNLFRLFSVNQGMGQPRMMPRKTKLGRDWVEIHWPATTAYQGEITARYMVRKPSFVDLEVTVRSKGTYPGYEVFLSNYFDKALKPAVYLQHRGGAASGKEPERVVPMFNPVFRDTLLVFARDAHAARRCVDGRWNRSEFDAPTVQMCPVRYYGYCLGVLTAGDDKPIVAMMSRPDHCYALSSRYHADREADRQTPYSAFDFSLFGNDMVEGDVRAVKVRLALIPNSTKADPVALYKEYVREAAK